MTADQIEEIVINALNQGSYNEIPTKEIFVMTT